MLHKCLGYTRQMLMLWLATASLPCIFRASLKQFFTTTFSSQRLFLIKKDFNSVVQTSLCRLNRIENLILQIAVNGARSKFVYRSVVYWRTYPMRTFEKSFSEKSNCGICFVCRLSDCDQSTPWSKGSGSIPYYCYTAEVSFCSRELHLISWERTKPWLFFWSGLLVSFLGLTW